MPYTMFYATIHRIVLIYDTLCDALYETLHNALHDKCFIRCFVQYDALYDALQPLQSLTNTQTNLIHAQSLTIREPLAHPRNLTKRVGEQTLSNCIQREQGHASINI